LQTLERVRKTVYMLAAYKTSIVLLTGLLLLYAFQGYYPEFMPFFSEAFPPLIAGAAVISSGFSLEKYWHRAKERFSAVWLFFTAGLFMWFVGETIWAGYALILNVEIPYPSVADVFRLSGYVPFFIALYLYVRTFGSALSRKTLAISSTITAVSAILVSAALIAPTTQAETELVTMIVDLAYPVLDLVLLSVSTLGLLVFLKGDLGKSWALISAGILLNVFGDVLFSYTVSRGTYYAGHPVDLLFDFAYVFFLLAFYVHVKEL